MRNWISFLQDAGQRAENAVLITVASTKGSVPRESGTKMVVTANDVYGTLGGGHLEFKAISIARRMIVAEGPRAMHRFPLGAMLGQCCGGLVNLLFEPVPFDASWVDMLAVRAAEEKICIVVTPVSGDARAGKLLFDVGSQACALATGTLGSAAIDAAARKIANVMLAGVQTTRLYSIAASPDAPGQECIFDLMCAPDFHVVLFGAGHVGRALVSVMAGLSCTITWVDVRENAFPSALPANVDAVCTDSPEAEVDVAKPGSYFLVMTHSHAIDLVLSECILRRGEFTYFGLIGSLSKRRQFERRLLERGISSAQMAAMDCPIGVAGISGKEPATIAIAVAAEILQRHETRVREFGEIPGASMNAIRI